MNTMGTKELRFEDIDDMDIRKLTKMPADEQVTDFQRWLYLTRINGKGLIDGYLAHPMRIDMPGYEKEFGKPWHEFTTDELHKIINELKTGDYLLSSSSVDIVVKALQKTYSYYKQENLLDSLPADLFIAENPKYIVEDYFRQYNPKMLPNFRKKLFKKIDDLYEDSKPDWAVYLKLICSLAMDGLSSDDMVDLTSDRLKRGVFETKRGIRINLSQESLGLLLEIRNIKSLSKHRNGAMQPLSEDGLVPFNIRETKTEKTPYRIANTKVASVFGRYLNGPLGIPYKITITWLNKLGFYDKLVETYGLETARNMISYKDQTTQLNNQLRHDAIMFGLEGLQTSILKINLMEVVY